MLDNFTWVLAMSFAAGLGWHFSAVLVDFALGILGDDD
jgi:hypothetical protein